MQVLTAEEITRAKEIVSEALGVVYNEWYFGEFKDKINSDEKFIEEFFAKLEKLV